ncbi:MAG: hypothetical protein JJ896_10695 [Rhodothermales bacterium]|nr:hypothetical protein [Rhodothermales bacterium]MBO6780109.1 hypothetical protein [Rhodothermales bacterium]
MMNCGHNQEELMLFHAGELPGQEAVLVEARVASCPDCRRELDALAGLVAFVEPPELNPEAVAQARARAYAQIGADWRTQRRRAAQKVRGWLERLRPLPELALAAMLVAVGFGLGASTRGDEIRALDQTFVDIRDILVDPETGVAEVRFDRLEQAAVRGGLGDEPMVAVLETALSADRDNRIRLHALRTVSELARTSAPNSDVAEAVILMVRAEEEDAMRLRAIRALDAMYAGRSLPDEARTALLDALVSEAGDGVRIAALEALMAHEPSVRDAGRLLHVSTSDPNPYVRSGAARALEELDSTPLEQIR